MDNSCLGCTKREVGCHGRCKDYQEWKKKHDREVIERGKARRMNTVMRDLAENRCRSRMNNNDLNRYRSMKRRGDR